MSRPLGVTIISLFLALSGVFSLLAGTEALGITKFGLSLATGAGLSGGASIVAGLLTLLLAFGLFSLSGWARTYVVVVMVVRILVDLYALFTHGFTSPLGIAALVSLGFSLLVLGYFRSPSVKDAFGA